MSRKFSTGLIVLLALGLLVPGMSLAQEGGETPTPEATPTDTAEEPVGEAEQPTLEGPFTYLQFAQFSYDAPGLEVNIDGEPSDIQSLAFGGVSGWVELPPDRYQIALVPIGQDLDAALVGPVAYSLAPNVWTTLAAVGSAEAGDFTVQVLRLDYSALDENMARVAFFHALQGAPAVDVSLDDGTVLASDVGYALDTTGVNSGLAEFELNAGTYSLRVTPTGAAEPVIASLGDLELEAQTLYLIAAFGTVDAPVVQVESYAIQDLSEMTNATFGAAAEEDVTTDAGTETEMEATPAATETAVPAG